MVDGMGPGLTVLAPLVGGGVLALLMIPLHAVLARHRRLALLVDRIVTDRIARLTGAERRRAFRHLHREAGTPALRAAAYAALAGIVTLVGTVLASSFWGPGLAVVRRDGLRAAVAALENAGLPRPGLVLGLLPGSGIAALALIALAVGSMHVGALDVERRRQMPVTRPWLLRRAHATLLLAGAVFLVLVAAGTAVAAALFLFAHQLVARLARPGMCREAPVIPEALRAARLPGPRERRLLPPKRPSTSAAGSPAAGPAESAGPAPVPPRPSVGSGSVGPGLRGSGSVGSTSHYGPAAPVPRTPVPHTRLIDMAPAELALRPHDPRTVGDYRLTGRLGSGGMGTVYLGQRAGTKGSVAIKVLAPHLLDDVDARTRFLQEGQTLKKVTGDYTARVLGVGFDGSMPFIVMERLDGPSLHAFVAASGSVTDGEMLTRTAIALARALAALHADGITHRDLKPGNILLTSVGPKVVDFGIAKVVGQTRHTPVGNMVGTPGYMAPEQVTGNGAGPATDIWAWACCVVFAARGDHLFDGENIVDIARQILDGPPSDAFTRVGRLSPRLVPVLRRATAQDPSERPRDGAALLRLLDRSGATATVGPAAWDRLVGAGVR